MTLKRVQTALSGSPIPGPRGRRLAAGSSRLHADSRAGVDTETVSGTVDETESNLETLDSSYRDFQQGDDMHHSQQEPVYYDDDSNSQFEEDSDNRQRSVTVTNERQGSAVSAAARERSHTVVPMPQNNSTTHASSYSQSKAQHPDTTMQGASSANGDPEDLVDFADKARLVLFTVKPDS